MVSAVIFVLSIFPLHLPLDLKTPQLLIIIMSILPWLSDFIESITIGGNTIKTRVQENEKNIKYIIQLMHYVLTRHQLHLLQFENGVEIRVRVPANNAQEPSYEGFKNDVLRLRGLELIANKILPGGGGGFSELEKGEPGERNATEYFEITPEGRVFSRNTEEAR
jgi:hypothetical protein